MKGVNKYIIVENTQGEERAILLPWDISHNQAVNACEIKPVSAGMWYSNPGSMLAIRGVVVMEHGSVSLGINSRPQDAAIIADHLEEILGTELDGTIKPDKRLIPATMEAAR